MYGCLVSDVTKSKTYDKLLQSQYARMRVTVLVHVCPIDRRLGRTTATFVLSLYLRLHPVMVLQ
jgi:hypothetical protein